MRLHRRGRRGGEHRRLHRLAVQSVTSPVGRPARARYIPTIIGNRRLSNVNNGQRDARATAVKTVQQSCSRVVIRLGLFDAYLVGENQLPFNTVDAQWMFATAISRPSTSVRTTVCRHGNLNPLSVGVLNSCSIHNKFASIANLITDGQLNVIGVDETWHDSHDCPDLITCTPPGYSYIERPRDSSPSTYARITAVSLCYTGMK